MSEEEQGTSGAADWIRDHLGQITGVVGLVAWLLMLWFMFGDVL